MFRLKNQELNNISVMIELIYGGSGSGKSSFAEDEIMKIKNSQKFYIATMKNLDEESAKKILRHKEMRKNKNFITIEQSENLSEACKIICDLKNQNKNLEELEETAKLKNQQNQNKTKKNSVLLECVSNLLANEMFKNGKKLNQNFVAKKIISDLEKIISCTDNLFIVSNNIFDDGIEYSQSSKNYMIALSKINSYIAKRADNVFEVVVGFPQKRK